MKRAWRCGCGVLADTNRVCGNSAFCVNCWPQHSAANPYALATVRP